MLLLGLGEPSLVLQFAVAGLSLNLLQDCFELARIVAFSLDEQMESVHPTGPRLLQHRIGMHQLDFVCIGLKVLVMKPR